MTSSRGRFAVTITGRALTIAMVAGLLAISATAALAGDHDGLFLGAAYGHNSGDTNVAVQSGSQIVEGNVHSSEPAWRVFGGYRWPYFSLEGGYRDLGTSEGTVADSAVTVGYRGWDVAVEGSLPIDRFELFGKLGRFFFDRRETLDGAGYGTLHGDTALIGLGVAVRWPSFALRLEWERSGVLDPGLVDFVSMVTVGVTVNL